MLSIRSEGFWAESSCCLLHIPSSFSSVTPATKCAEHEISDHEYASVFPGRSISILVLFICYSFIYLLSHHPESDFYFDYWKWQKPYRFVSYVAYKGIDSRDNILKKPSDIKNSRIFYVLQMVRTQDDHSRKEDWPLHWHV